MTTTIIIPCYNEEKRLNQDEFIQFVQKNPSVHFLFVNDGSKDNTWHILQDLSSLHPQLHCLDIQPNGGKAEAVRKGMMYAHDNIPSDFFGFWDADLATPLYEINNFVQQIQRENYTIVTGLRLMRLGAKVKRKKTRHYLGRCFATAASIALGLPVYDTQCGSKLYKSNIVPLLFNKPFITRWLFDVELLARYKKEFGSHNAITDIYEYPLLEWEDVHGSQVKMKDFFKAPYELLKIIKEYK